MNPIKDRVIAVIGGANGIGKEISRLLAGVGARIAIGDRDGSAAAATAALLPGQVMALSVDVTDPASIEAYVAGVEDNWGRIDAVINSAGIMWVGPFDQEPVSTAQAQLNVNLLGTINVVKAVAPRMKCNKSGHIIVIASAASVLPTPGEATYSASKHGIFGYLKAVRVELRGSGVDVSVVMPTVVETALAAGTSPGAAKMLQPEDVARAVGTTLLRPRFEVPIPGYLGPTHRVIDMLPQLLRDFVYRRLVPDQVQSVDRSARADYESQQVDAGH